MGTVFGFLRSDQSWHGHKPSTGERRVVQAAWIVDAKELARNKQRNVAKALKSSSIGDGPSGVRLTSIDIKSKSLSIGMDPRHRTSEPLPDRWTDSRLV